MERIFQRPGTPDITSVLAARPRVRTEHNLQVASSVIYPKHPFRLHTQRLVAEPDKLVVGMGAVNDIVPASVGVPLTLSAGANHVYVKATIDGTMSSDTFGEIETLEIVVLAAPAAPPTLTVTFFRLGIVEVGIEESVLRATSILQEATYSLRLVRFYGNYVFLPLGGWPA